MIKGYKRLINKIKAIQEKYKTLPDEELAEKTAELRLKAGEKNSLKAIMPHAYAVVCEAARRVLKMQPYDVQIMAGIVLNGNNIAEMKTGEGKTLSAAFSSYLNALTGKGVHVVTCNDYLAKRDADEIGSLHEFLGLSVGCVTHETDRAARKREYDCDITYVTNLELGFDYLRDNMVRSREDKVLKGLNYCIIDEADSILIDEARTPLIISGLKNDEKELFIKADRFAKTLMKGEAIFDKNSYSSADDFANRTGDFVIDEETKGVYLTDSGTAKAEKFFGIKNLADGAADGIRHHIELALRANHIMKRDGDYIVSGGSVKIVDEFTGRVMEGRRYSDGLHQAIEAKENVEIQAAGKTLAQITYQMFFGKYDKVSGMTGTAYSEKAEFKDTYGLDVIKIPTNRPVVRNDMPDIMFDTKRNKYAAIVSAVEESHKTGRPVLVGTASVAESEELGKMLGEKGIEHSVLNARQNKEEARIIAKAGRFGAVTIATNMAGRGTDIKLDESAKKAGGLFVIGSERSFSRRVDDQLKGRAGRQGDVGASVFYLSLEDEMIKKFGDKRAAARLWESGSIATGRIESGAVNSFIKSAQRNAEGTDYMARKSVLDYDKILDSQRELIYNERDRILNSNSLSATVDRIFMNTAVYSAKASEGGRFKDLRNRFYKEMRQTYTAFKKSERFSRLHTDIECKVLLKIIDAKWAKHLEDLEFIRQGVQMQNIGQNDPKTEYAAAAYDLFDEMLVEDTVGAAQVLLGVAAKAV